MKILQLAPIWETVPPPAYGGTEAVIHVLTEELVRRGHEVTLCASGDSSTSADLWSVFPQSLRPAGLDGEALQYSLVHTAMALKEARGYDLVHAHTGPPSELAMAMSHLIDVPMLITLHNEPFEGSRFIWNNYSGWFNTISQAQIAKLTGETRAQFAGVVHNSIDVASFPWTPAKDDYFLFIGRITRDKAPHLAVEAAKRLGAKIVIAGKIATWDEHEYFHDVIEPLVDGDQVRFVGEADAALKRELYAGARALLLPLQWDEPFGLVMIEAMACGTLPIVFNRGAASEILVDGETGFLVHDLDGMVEAMQRLDSIDPCNCRLHVEAHFSPSHMAESYLTIYEKILGVKVTAHDRVYV